MNQKVQMCGAYEDPLYVHSSTWRAYFACVQKGIKCTVPDPASPRFQYIEDSYINCDHMLISMQKWKVRRNVVCLQHIVMDGSSLRCTSLGLIKPEMMSWQLTALLASSLLTAQLAFLSPYIALLRTTQGCRNVVNCKKKKPLHLSSRGVKSAAVAAVTDQWLIQSQLLFSKACLRCAASGILCSTNLFLMHQTFVQCENGTDGTDWELMEKWGLFLWRSYLL